MEFQISKFPKSIQPVLKAIDAEVGGHDGVTSAEEVRLIFEGGASEGTLWEAFEEPKTLRRDEMELVIHDRFIKPTRFTGQRVIETWNNAAPGQLRSRETDSREGTRQLKLRKVSPHRYEATVRGRKITLTPAKPTRRGAARRGGPVFEGHWADEATAAQSHRRVSLLDGRGVTNFEKPGQRTSIRIKEGTSPTDLYVEVVELRAQRKDGHLVQTRDTFNGRALSTKHVESESALPEGIARMPNGPVAIFPTHAPLLRPTPTTCRSIKEWFPPNYAITQWSDAQLRKRFPEGLAPTPELFEVCDGAGDAVTKLLHTMARSRELARPRDPRLQVLKHEKVDVDVAAITPSINRMSPIESSAWAVRRFAHAYGINERKLKIDDRPLSKWLPSKEW